MADYYPLISGAVAGLEKNTGENRRVLYERARAALVAQLRGVEPALEEADITRERLALEEAIRKVEADAAKRPSPSRPSCRTARARRSPEPPREEPPTPTSLRDRGLRDFCETMAGADELGGAASHANRSARQTFEALPGDRRPPPADRGAPADDASTHYFEPPGETTSHVLDRALGRAREWRRRALHRACRAAAAADRRGGRRARLSAGALAWPPAQTRAALLVLAGLAGAGYWQRQAHQHGGEPDAASRAAPAPRAGAGARRQAEDRRPRRPRPPRCGQPANAPTAAVAQKVVLYEEEQADPQGKRYVGSAIWRTETVSPGPGLAPELAVRADVEIPERHMRMTWSLRRNTDKALPASHTIEIMFTLPADFDQGSINNVPGVLMKPSEQARGVPLAGLAVKVTNGYFLIGLSAVEIDVQRNVALLKDRDWFDIPIVYTSGKRAILAMEKGTPGARAFAEAFRAWGE